MATAHLLIEKLLGWPPIVFTILFIYRKELAAVLSRLTDFLGRAESVDVGRSGLTFRAGSTVVSAQSEAPPVSERLKELRNIAVSPLIQEQEARIQADLTTAGVAVDERVGLLAKHLAVAQAGWTFEYTYRTILGSQIALLKFVNTAPGSPKSAILPFYERAQEASPDAFKDFPFEVYLHYLKTNALLLEQEGRYTVTVKGREFLKWIQETGVTELKSF